MADSFASFSLFVALISLDRAWSIVYPVHYKCKSTINLAMTLLIIPWVMSFCCWGLPILLWNIITGNDEGQSGKCELPFRDNDDVKAFLRVMNFHVPFLVITSCNILIVIVVIKRSNKLKLSFIKDLTKMTKQKRDVKSARALALLVIVFMITWAPHEILSIIEPICDNCISSVIKWSTYYLVWFNSAINPFIYPMMQKQMRETMWSLFCGKKQMNEVVPFVTEASKVKHILVKSYADKIGNKIGIPIFENSDNDTNVLIPTAKHDNILSKRNAITKEPSKPYYMKETSKNRINQVQPQPRSKHLTRTLPTGPTIKRSKLLRKGEHKSDEKKHSKKEFKKVDNIHICQNDYE